MAGDVAPRLGHRFAFGADWGHVDCEVVEVEPERRLAYSWDGKGLESTVTWTLTPTGTGTHLRMEQTGFRPDQKRAYHGARAGWPRFLTDLDELLARIGWQNGAKTDEIEPVYPRSEEHPTELQSIMRIS